MVIVETKLERQERKIAKLLLDYKKVSNIQNILDTLTDYFVDDIYDKLDGIATDISDELKTEYDIEV